MSKRSGAQECDAAGQQLTHFTSLLLCDIMQAPENPLSVPSPPSHPTGPKQDLLKGSRHVQKC